MSVKGFITKYFGEVAQGAGEAVAVPVIRQVKTFTPSLPVASPQSSDTQKLFHIFTDGACSDNGRRGARGGFGVHYYSMKGMGLDLSEPLMNNEPQTNNRGELRAIQAALDTIDKYDSEWKKEFNGYCIWSDSEYSINSLTKWAPNWRKNGWKKGDGGLIQNIDLIKPIYEKLCRMSSINLRHVRAHQKGKENEFPYNGNTEADRLARASVRTFFSEGR